MVFKRWALVLLLLAGLSQFAQGGWIYLKASLAQQLLQHAWQKSLNNGHEIKPWPWADTSPIARLQLPRLEIDTIVLRGDHGQALAFGPGHAAGGVMPGEPGTLLISGHRDTHFRFMRDLVLGDRVRLESIGGAVRDYRIIETQIVDADSFRVDTVGPDRLLLATCWPFDTAVPGGPFRFIAIAETDSSLKEKG